ncbi:hypothetical protein H5410_028733 [Solanum commersonii]|uniref:Uncharacterized protein n=1 Tax=Solanum commersonii TaxID=4109 RepID=A0A9J5Z2Z0_SOLCO|nr:hypothetical protein H5410_028733 [Solanum commersonii]
MAHLLAAVSLPPALELRGQKLELRIIYISQKQVPLSCDGKETPQSNKISSVTGRLAVRAVKR